MPARTRAQRRADYYNSQRTPANRPSRFGSAQNLFRTTANLLQNEAVRNGIIGAARIGGGGNVRFSTKPPAKDRKRYGKIARMVAGRRRYPKKQYSPGTYGGKFKKPTVAGMKAGKAKYSSLGVMTTTEVTGTVNDPDCVYLTHTALVPVEMINMIVQALVRKLLKKSIQYNCTNVNEPIQAFTLAADWMVVLVSENLDTGVETNNQYATPSLVTVDQIAQNFSPFFRAYAQGGAYDNIENIRELIAFQLFMRDADGITQNFRLQGQLNLKDEIVHVFSKSYMKIQNRTLSAGGSEQTDTVSNNPLMGRTYDIKGGIPKIRDTSVNAILNTVSNVGVQLARAAQFAGTAGNVYKEPPMPQLIVNCGASSKIRLEPGQIKQDTIQVTYSKPLLAFLKKMGDPFYAVVTGNKYAHLIGKARMYALEDVINVNAAARIEIAYEVNRESGCYCTTRATKHVQGNFFAQTYSNNTPT